MASNSQNVCSGMVFVFPFLFIVWAVVSGELDIALSKLQGQLTTFQASVGNAQFPYPTNQFERKVLATIIGAAVGDALGRVTEFMLPQAIKAQFNGAQGITLETYFKKHTVQGKVIYTDDTVMAKIVLETALEGRDNNWNEQDIIRAMAIRFMPWVAMTEWVSVGHKDEGLYNYRAHGPTNQKAMARLRLK